MCTALYRDEDDYAIVAFGGTIIPVPKWRYDSGITYKTPFKDLPTKASFIASGGEDHSFRAEIVKNVSS